MAANIIPTAQGVTSLAMPDYLKEVPQEDHGTELLRQYVVPPRIKVCQPSMRKPFSDMFKPGDVIVVPNMQRLAGYTDGKEVAFCFTPIFFWVEWACWNPLEVKGQAPAIRERTLDPKSQIAVMAKDEKRRKGFTPYPESPEMSGKKLYLQYIEHLNYMLLPLEPSPYAGQAVCYSFAKGEHRAGTSFNALVKQRRAPLYSCNFAATVRERENQQGRWFGLDIDNPTEATGVTPFIMDPAYFEKLKSYFLEFRTLYESKLLQPDYEDVEETERPADSKDF